MVSVLLHGFNMVSLLYFLLYCTRNMSLYIFVLQTLDSGSPSTNDDLQVIIKYLLYSLTFADFVFNTCKLFCMMQFCIKTQHIGVILN